MRISNPSLLKRPWLFPIYTVIGAFLGLFFEGTNGLSATAITLLVVVSLTAINAWFFISLRQARKEQSASLADNAKPTGKGRRYLLFGLGIFLLLAGVV